MIEAQPQTQGSYTLTILTIIAALLIGVVIGMVLRSGPGPLVESSNDFVANASTNSTPTLAIPYDYRQALQCENISELLFIYYDDNCTGKNVNSIMRQCDAKIACAGRSS